MISTEYLMTNPTKFYSSKQEKLVADYNVWEVVSGSGARFQPGDVRSAVWLGECKTHSESDHKILFERKVWDKICREAMSQLRAPVLFVDDGSQSISQTWCMIPVSKVPVTDPAVVASPFPHPVRVNVTLSSDTALAKYKSDCIAAGVDIICWVTKDVAILPLEKFKQLIKEHL